MFCFYGTLQIEIHTKKAMIKVGVCVCVSVWAILVPVLLGDSVEGAEHQWQDDLTVLFYQTEDILIVPEIKSSLCYL